MIDKREGETKKPIPSSQDFFPQDRPKLPKGDVPGSQKKAPGQPYNGS